MPTRTFTEGDDTFVANTDEYNELYFLGGDDTLIQDGPEGTGAVEAYMGTGNDYVNYVSGEYGYAEGADGVDRFDFRSTTGSFYAFGGVGGDLFYVFGGADFSYAIGEEGSDTFRIQGDANRVFLDGGVGNDLFLGNRYMIADGDIYGRDGNDRFYEFMTGSTLLGGMGDDLYRINPDSPATIVENFDEGEDSVQVAVGANYTLGANLENISVQSFIVVDSEATLVGNNLDNDISGSSADETMYGLDGDDYLIGRGGDDTLYGGLGNDAYQVDRDGDLTIELAGEGIDTVRVDLRGEVNLTNETTADDVATYQMQDNIENLIAQFDIQHIISGNDLDNRIVGRAAADEINGRGGNDNIAGGAGDDTLRGEAGDDILFGNAGNDTLRGGDGNDTLQGNTGDDNMAGGLGDDRYIVDSTGDEVIEGAGEGNDTVFSFLTSYALDTNVENGVGLGSSIYLLGNDLNNGLTGTAGDDILEDQAGGADTFTGLAGADVLVSTTDGLSDTFVYTGLEDSTTASFDTVLGVEGGLGGDVFDLSLVDANANVDGDQAFTFIGGAEFTGTAGELRDDGDAIYGDVNGDGVADFMIVYDVGTGPALTGDNFIF